MSRFQLVFRRDGHADEFVLVDQPVIMDPMFDGQRLHDGASITRYGDTWSVTIDGDDTDENLTRFICTLA